MTVGQQEIKERLNKELRQVMKEIAWKEQSRCKQEMLGRENRTAM